MCVLSVFIGLFIYPGTSGDLVVITCKGTTSCGFNML